MQLIYRGVNYLPQPRQRQYSDFSTTTGKYRGITYCISPVTVASHQSLVAYKYRGVDYIKMH